MTQEEYDYERWAEQKYYEELERRAAEQRAEQEYMWLLQEFSTRSCAVCEEKLRCLTNIPGNNIDICRTAHGYPSA